jgi:hypothetical protein
MNIILFDVRVFRGQYREELKLYITVLVLKVWGKAI